MANQINPQILAQIQSLRAQAQTHLNNQEWLEAERVLNSILPLRQPGDLDYPDFWLDLANVNLRLGVLDKAQIFLEAARSSGSLGPDGRIRVALFYTVLGGNYSGQQNWGFAEYCLQQAISLGLQNDPAVYANLAVAQLNQAKWSEAEANCLQAISMGLQGPEIFVHFEYVQRMSVLEFATKLSAEPKADFKEIIKKQQDQVTSLDRSSSEFRRRSSREAGHSYN